MKNNQLYYGDNLDILRKYIKDETIDICYIDPPFNSKRNYNQIYNNIGHEDKAQAQAFVDTWTWDEYAEHGLNDIVENRNNVFTKQSIELITGLLKVLGKDSLMAYLISMTLRVAEIYRVLKPTGSFYFHCDPTSSHYLKLVLDSIFCAQGGDIRNEIIWSYKRYTAFSKRFQRLHDVVFFYTKTDNYTFNTFREDYGEKSGKADSHYKQDEEGKWYRWQKRKGAEPYKIYLSEGRRGGDVWEIPLINASAKERLGYPTQKPEELLEKIIQASSNENDIILDAYSGCGTSIAVAQKLNRNWIGIDITYQSISLMLNRLVKSYGKSILDKVILHGIPKDIDSAVNLANKKDDRVRKEFEKWAVLTYSDNTAIINEKKGGDGGIDGISYIMDKDDTENVFKQIIFSVKSDKNVVPAYVRDLYGTVSREKAVMGVLIVLYSKESIKKECHKYGLYNNKLFNKEYPCITVVSVEEILNGTRIFIPTTNRTDVIKQVDLKENNKDQL